SFVDQAAQRHQRRIAEQRRRRQGGFGLVERGGRRKRGRIPRGGQGRQHAVGGGRGGPLRAQRWRPADDAQEQDLGAASGEHEPGQPQRGGRGRGGGPGTQPRGGA